jgi:hypothetical protein
MTRSFNSHNGTHRTIRLEDTICIHCAKLAFRSLVLHAGQEPIIVSHCRVCGMTTHHPAKAADIIHAQELELYRMSNHPLAEAG